MKKYEEMDFRERIDYAVGHLALSIGEGKFRQGVASLLDAEARAAYERGLKEGARREKEKRRGKSS